MATPPLTLTLTKLRESILEALAGGFPEHLWLSGILEGPIEHRRPVGCVYPAEMHEMDDNLDVTELELRVRLFDPFRQRTDPLELYSPATLEEWAERLPVCLGAITTEPDAPAGGSTWYFRVTRVEFDLRAQGLEASILGYAWNPYPAGS